MDKDLCKIALQIANVLLVVASLAISIFTVVNQNISSNQIDVLLDLKSQVPFINSTITNLVEEFNIKTKEEISNLKKRKYEFITNYTSDASGNYKFKSR